MPWLNISNRTHKIAQSALYISMCKCVYDCLGRAMFLADRTNGRAYATVLHLSVVCNVMYCG